MKRTSAGRSPASSPSTRYVRSSSTWRSPACARGERLSISSMKSVPSFARAITPGLSRTAPLNAPLRQPKSSASWRSSGSAERSSISNGPVRTTECSWQKRARRDFPVPVGPLMRIGSSCFTKTRSSSMSGAIDAPTTGRSGSASDDRVGRTGSDVRLVAARSARSWRRAPQPDQMNGRPIALRQSASSEIIPSTRSPAPRKGTT